MSVIDIDLAMKHLLAEPEDLVLIQAQLDGAEEAAQQFLQRRFFADQAGVAQAKADTVLRTKAALAQYQAALVIADDPDNSDIRCRLREQARQALADAYEQIDLDEYGIVINAAITAACLLKLGNLFANREEVDVGVTAVELPQASKSLLMPYRIRMGV
jgi:hypothetical protein